jgi:hypothetical protein
MKRAPGLKSKVLREKKMFVWKRTLGLKSKVLENVWMKRTLGLKSKV